MKSQSLRYNMLFLIPVLAFILPFVSEAVVLPQATTGKHSTSCNTLFQSSIHSTIRSLAELRMKLDLAQAKGTASIALTALQYDYQMKEQELAQHLAATNGTTAAELKDRIKQEIGRLQVGSARSRQEEKEQQEKQAREMREALDPLTHARKAVFHDIRPGKFLMGEPGKQVEVEITIPFAMMDTPVTQMMWARLKIAMGEKDLDRISPSINKSDTGGSAININGFDVELKANHPVERVNWQDVQAFANDLNKLSNREDKDVQRLLKETIPGHQPKDIYDLPTEVQWELVMTNRGKANKIYFDRDDKVDLHNYGWFGENSKSKKYPDGSTRAVATRQPRIIDGNLFFDLEGNVWEWLKDQEVAIPQLFADSSLLSLNEPLHLIRGGSWIPDNRAGYLWNRAKVFENRRNNALGFRMVRYRQ